MFYEEYKRWVDSNSLTTKEREELLAIENDSDLIKMRFSEPMSFGTAGLRSTMYMGIGCMNRFTVAQTTRALAQLVISCEVSDRGVVIAYDSRNNSELFAKVSASVLAYYGVRVFIFDGLRPTPELSFAVRELNCVAGINITASHNPKEYNGYKAYWEDGAQIGPMQAKTISSERGKYDVLDFTGADSFREFTEEGRITLLGKDFDEKYISAVLSTSVSLDTVRRVAEDLKIVYTPLHGAGYRMVPEVLSRIGVKHLYTVDEQSVPDGNFPTVKKPNPEYAEVFSLGIKIADSVGSDLVIATDPDSDRVGVMARDHDGRFVTVSGNQMGALLLDYIIKTKKSNGSLPKNAFAVKSIVSTDMAYGICKAHGVVMHDVLTGFKYIGEVIKNYEAIGEENSFLLGFEESYGYLLGTYARDKDAVEATMIIVEMTAYYKERNMTLCDALNALYAEYGFYGEAMLEVYMEGVDGVERMRRVMDALRTSPPAKIGDRQLELVGDYLLGAFTDVRSGAAEPTGQPKSDVLCFTLDGGDKIIVRPSGTEPKIKLYILANARSKAELCKKIENYKEHASRLIDR